jgi:hypothetical protein
MYALVVEVRQRIDQDPLLLAAKNESVLHFFRAPLRREKLVLTKQGEPESRNGRLDIRHRCHPTS